MPRLRPANGGVSLTITLAASISALVFIAVVSVLGLGLWSGSQNTMSLLRDKATAMIDSTVDRVRIHLDASQDQVNFIEQLVAQGSISPSDRPQFVATLTGALAAAPQISALLFIDVNHQTIIVIRKPQGSTTVYRDDSADADLRRVLATTLKNKQAAWGTPRWLPDPKVSILNLRMPLMRDGKPVGVLIATVTVRELSSYLSDLDSGGASNLFVLYDRQNVLAHPNLASGTVRCNSPRFVGCLDPVRNRARDPFNISR